MKITFFAKSAETEGRREKHLIPTQLWGVVGGGAIERHG